MWKLEYKRRLVKGLVSSALRKLFAQLIVTGSNIILARLLLPTAWGTFGIIIFIVSGIGALLSFGLSSALVQREEAPNVNVLQTVFTTYFISVGFFTIVIYFLAPLIDSLYRGALGQSGIFWLRIYPTYLFLVLITSISGALYEREMEYQKLAIIEVVTLLTANMCVIGLALLGFGIGSFALGNIVGISVGFVASYLNRPWKIGFQFSWESLSAYLPFSRGATGNMAVGLINSAIVPGLIGVLSGPTAVGLINWAGGVRQAVLGPYEVVDRLGFSAFSRARIDKRFLKTLVEKLIMLSALTTLPLLTIAVSLASELTVIVYSPVWLAGLTALYLSLIQGGFIFIGALLIHVLMASGKTEKVRNISLFWALLQWILSIPLVLIWNFNGVVLAGLIVSATFFIPMREVKKIVPVRVFPQVFPYLLYSLVAVFPVIILKQLIVIDTFLKIIGTGLSGLISYAIFLYIIERKKINQNIKLLRMLIKV